MGPAPKLQIFLLYDFIVHYNLKSLTSRFRNFKLISKIKVQVIDAVVLQP